MPYKNLQEGREKTLARLKKYKKASLKFINRYKNFYGCKFCGEKNFICLDFHHINKKNKRSFKLLRKYPLKHIKEEIKKCIILCRNCHNKLHYEERNINYKLKIEKLKKKLFTLISLKEKKNLKRRIERTKKAAYINSLKSKNKCKICGEKNIGCLLFHHLDPLKKRISIEYLPTHFGIKTIKEELKKCIILCQNCHTKLHNKK